MKTLFVVGTFDDNGGRASSYGKKFIEQYLVQCATVEYDALNGGNFCELEKIVFTDYSTIFWFADVPNDKPKLVDEIKKNNPTCMLITSKRNDDGEYDTLQLISRALKTKSNLLIEFSKQKNPVRMMGHWIDGCVTASVLDPLGNCFVRTASIETVVWTLSHRLDSLRSFTRMPSVKSIARPETPEPPPKGFVELVQNYATKFHELIAAPTERFLGNASFRCQSGFPSYRSEDGIYVSKRNINKCSIGDNGFVRVNTGGDCVLYYGDHKPSVDTPIQLALYGMFPRINFMLHSHTYVADAPFTTKIVPCGALQEVDEIQAIVPSAQCNWFFINLRGHGSLCAVEQYSMLSNIRYVARQIPEMAGPWL